MTALAEVLPHVIGLGVLLFLSGFFSGSETALFSLSRTQARRMRHGSRPARTATELLRDPQRLLSTILVGNMLVNVATASIIAGMARHFLDDRGVAIAIGASTLLLLVFGEVTPKTIAVRHAEGFASSVALPLLMFSRLIAPVRLVLQGLTASALRLVGLSGVASWGTLTGEELVAVLAAGEANGAAGGHERRLAEHILNLGNVNARDVMVPRTEVQAVDDCTTVAEAFAAACRLRRSRLPVYSDDLDDIWGVLCIVDLPRWRGTPEMHRSLADFRSLAAGHDDGDPRLASPVYPAILVPETARLDMLLGHMRRGRAQMAVLVDEYGGTAGILTMEDLLAEVVGRITPADEVEGVAVRIEGNRFLTDGRTHLRDVNRVVGCELVQNGSDSVGGYVMEHLGRLPRAGDALERDGLSFTVVRMTGRRVGSLAIELLPQAGEGGEE